MNSTQELEKIVKIALKDGIITEKEREIIFKKAESLGIDEFEAEMIMEGMLPDDSHSANQPIDGFNISNEELLLRVQKWVDLSTENNIKIEVEAFPKIDKDITQIEKYLDVGSDLLNKISSSNLLSVAGRVPGIGMAMKLGGKMMSNTKKMKNDEILEITNKYLIILELRAKADSFMKVKHEEFKNKFEQKQHEMKNKKKGWLF